MKKNKLSIKDIKQLKHVKLHRQNAIKGGRSAIIHLIVKGDGGFIGSAVDITVQPPIAPLGNNDRENSGLAVSITIEG